ncbi:hypothetical protein [Labilibacter marinus]|uniref:hypothetical protein n=1 Tax=Labilibacter marinus TaxID=1477105 RepID=UPI00094FADC0|nr:hypothetical protein [Labilibacter marinus]
MEQVQQDGKAGFLGGCLVSLFKSVALENIMETIVYAIIGTVVSFVVSMLLRYLVGLVKKK